ncbi:methyltransferase domain-containing protein [Arhodomonas aquaeolei]|nr:MULTISPECIES: methyltransferase domain-containing protein [Arhodomonas]MCS4503055.1 methyltransferase domain-containing protein [Arhodomonas aquaeolei]
MKERRTHSMSEHYENSGVDRLYSAVWGENIHYGVYETGDEGIETATWAAKRLMAEAARLSPGERVLEVACGYGATARYLAEEYGVSVVASNISETQLARCREMAESRALDDRVSFEYADFHELPFPDESFDVWWCQESMVHSPDKERVLREAYRVLKPGGRAVISDHIFWHERLTPQERAAVEARYGMSNLSSPADYERHIEAAGFTLVEHRDWQRHAALHRAKVLARLEQHMSEFAREMDAETLENNHRSWAHWADLAAEGKLSLDFYLAEKPAR